MNDRIKELADKLRLRGMANKLDDILNEAEKQGSSIDEVLLKLLEVEYLDQQERSLENRIQRARIPWDWTIDTFPFEEQPGLNKTQIMGLTKLRFIERHENIILIGEPGTGKSGIAISLLRLALLNGYRCRFYNAQDLLDALYTSLADRSTSKLLNTLCNYDALLIDELGYLTLTTEQINIFFKLIAMRYQKKSTIITTNLDFEAWYDVFKQKELVAAMLDRFKHYCAVIRINGPSLREPKSSLEEAFADEGVVKKAKKIKISKTNKK